MADGQATGRRVALITGAASGIGLACVGTMLKADWRVAAVDPMDALRSD